MTFSITRVLEEEFKKAVAALILPRIAKCKFRYVDVLMEPVVTIDGPATASGEWVNEDIQVPEGTVDAWRIYGVQIVYLDKDDIELFYIFVATCGRYGQLQIRLRTTMPDDLYFM